MKLPALFLALMLACLQLPLAAQEIKSPEAAFGFRMGEDRRLVNWEQIVSYMTALSAASPRVQLVELGRTTLERPMIMMVISGEKTMADLGKYRQIQQQLARPYGLTSEAASDLIREGKTVCLITLNIHSTEIAASQEALELAYELATVNDARIHNILDNVILLMVPSLNPDGQDMITKWYLQHAGTPAEGSRMPYKYHFYADHDNNRDWFFFSLQESRLMAQVLYHDWYPEIVMDQHQMGSTGARFFLPPYADPVNPNVAPSVMANTNLVGKHIIAEMQDQGFKGLVTNTVFNAFFEGTMSKTPLWHNRIGILTEAASARVATPLFFPRTSLRGMGQDLPEYKQQTNFLDPWPGGWWRLRDIVEYQKAAALSLLDMAAMYKEKFKTNFYELNRRAIEVKPEDHPEAYVLPQDQHDPGNLLELLRRLRYANVDIFQAGKDFRSAAGDFRAGDFVIPLAQPARAYVKDLLERQHYPDLREYPGGPPRQPYDVTAWTLPLQMGVKAVALNEALTIPLERVETLRLDIDNSWIQPGWVAIERRFTHGHQLVNRLAKSDIDIFELTEDVGGFSRGTFLVRCDAGNRERLQSLADGTQIQLQQLPLPAGEPAPPLQKIRPARIGIYQPWIPWVYDEGWLRLVLDNFEFSYQVLHNPDLQKKSSLSDKLDVLILTSQNRGSILKGLSGREKKLGDPELPAEYNGGIGDKGVEAIRKFVNNGGTLLCFGEACEFAIEKLRLPAENVLENLGRKDFFIPGSILEMTLDGGSALSYGMPAQVPVYINNRVALKLLPYPAEIRETGFYAERQLLLSGWAVGEELLHGKAALAEIPVGKGKVILYAFRPQHRSQTYGTFKLIFNALY